MRTCLAGQRSPHRAPAQGDDNHAQNLYLSKGTASVATRPALHVHAALTPQQTIAAHSPQAFEQLHRIALQNEHRQQGRATAR
eukprot:2914057-Pleurochrysis_carterae.AAC.2